MSGLPFIVLGDSTTGGGKVIEGSPYSTINGKPIARVGDKVACPAHKGVFPIMTGDATCLIDDKPAARHDDSVACGCKLIGSQTLATTGGTGENKSSNASSKAGSGTSASTSKGSPAENSDDEDLVQYFEFVDAATGERVDYPVDYKLVADGETLVEGPLKGGKTDEFPMSMSLKLTAWNRRT